MKTMFDRPTAFRREKPPTSEASEPFDCLAVQDARAEPWETSPSHQSESEQLALEIIIRFGNSVLYVTHLCPPRCFRVGQSAEGLPVDVELPPEALGRTQLPLVELHGGAAHLLVPEGVLGRYRKNRIEGPLSELDDQSRPCEKAPRARCLPLVRGTSATIDLPGLVIHVAAVERAPEMRRGLLANWDWSVPGYFGVSFGTFASLMAMVAFFAPPLGIVDEEGLDQKRLLLLSQYLDAAAEKERPLVSELEQDSGSQGGAEGQRAKGREGEAGKEDIERRNKRAAVAGPATNQDLQLPPDRVLDEAQRFGLVGLLRASLAGDQFVPSSVFGRSQALGSDALSAQGNMWGDTLGESGGGGALGLLGSGSGGGDLFGHALGIGMGEVGTVGGGRGREGMASGRGRPGGHHQSKSPSLRPSGKPVVSGRIPPHVIQRVVRQNFGRFRMCYERGLGRNPMLEGRVTVRFVIGADGAVSAASPGGDLPDGDVKRCVASGFYGLSFPPPEGGVVQVAYPLLFSAE